MLTDSAFQTLAQATLVRLHDALELAYNTGAIEELELEPGLLTIVSATGKTFIVSAHAASGQIWLASPLSGGLHFRWHEAARHWSLGNGDTLETTLTRELSHQQIDISL